MLSIGVTGCMSKASSQEAILAYLEEKYDEKFEVEAFKEGSEAFKQMYGADKVIVHPEGKPEHVFLAGEDRDHEGEYYDNYVLSIWQDELTKHYKEEISKILAGIDYRYRVLLYTQDGYDSSFKEMSVFNYLENGHNDSSLIINVAILTSKAPSLNEYSEQILQLNKLANTANTKPAGVSIGFVDQEVDVTDYIRTSAVNNVQWSNMIGKVYGQITIDNRLNITNSNQLSEYFETFEE
ncbi:hypothetical protein [Aquibacillus kalidii]|uniref:hypothetical protein n=1 Tax=Aquibacillus kalidii TaxID=2762597 RepID=UPI001C9907E4|nr:hypothetical protein [Aquibacillus kalidii]